MFNVLKTCTGSHGIPGIFFKYDTSALKVLVSEEREPLDQFLVRLCAIVGGYFVTAGKCQLLSKDISFTK